MQTMIMSILFHHLQLYNYGAKLETSLSLISTSRCDAHKRFSQQNCCKQMANVNNDNKLWQLALYCVRSQHEWEL